MLNGKVNLSLSDGAANLTDKLKKASLNLDTLLVNNTSASFSGTVSYEGNEYKIDAQGTVGKGYLVGAGLVGQQFTDNQGNFDVTYFTIEDNSSRLFISPSLKNTKVLKIYLLRKNTHELVMFEESFSKIQGDTNKFNVNYDINEIKDVDSGVEYWFYGFCTQITPMTLTGGSGTDTTIYTEHTSSLGATFDFTVTVKESASVSNVGSGQALQTTRLALTLKTVSSDPQFNSNNAPFVVNNTHIYAACGSGDELIQDNWAGKAYTAFSQSTSVYANLGLGIPGLSWATFNVGWTPTSGQSEQFGSIHNYYPSGGLYVKGADIVMPSQLTQTGHYYDYSVVVHAINGKNLGNRSMGFKWDFGIYERNLLGTDYTKLVS
ncbi:hypothetical protein [Clostridium tagluense]|uniref:hypothetical protein n=1 Tax=Clostridium tagluense TaxID=360422 RepID=UPI001CF0FE8D|nr:hypothetical protein [Clostridium tagluense]MCB2300011.1 hypothetical protein [Clostridium tagluense]